VLMVRKKPKSQKRIHADFQKPKTKSGATYRWQVQTGGEEKKGCPKVPKGAREIRMNKNTQAEGAKKIEKHIDVFGNPACGKKRRRPGAGATP